jgi:hypothetical protein
MAVSGGSGGDVGVTGGDVEATAVSGESGVDVVGAARDSAGATVVPGDGLLLMSVGEDITKILRVGREAVGVKSSVCFKPNHRVRPEPIVTKVTARQSPINRMTPMMKMILYCFFFNLAGLSIIYTGHGHTVTFCFGDWLLEIGDNNL